MEAFRTSVGLMQLDVIGLPAPKGSKKAFLHKTTGRPVVVESAGRALRSWEEAIAQAARDHLARQPAPPMTGPLAMTIGFRFPTVKSDPYRYWHATKPDIDKLERAVCDALKVGGLISDDCVISKLSGAKRYIIGDENTGCTIDIENLAGEEAEIREGLKERARRQRGGRVDDNQERLLA